MINKVSSILILLLVSSMIHSSEGKTLRATKAVSTPKNEDNRNLQVSLYDRAFNIIEDGTIALAVDTSRGCNSLNSVTNVQFLQTFGFEGSLTTDPRYHWKYNPDTKLIESVVCPGKVLDVTASNCDKGEVIIYGEHAGPNQQWDIFRLGGTSGEYAIRNVHCHEFLQAVTPVRVDVLSTVSGFTRRFV